MALLLNCGAIFLHVPKTGGSWVTEVLFQQGLVKKQFGHIHADMVRALYYTDGVTTVARSMFDWSKSLLPTRWKAFGPLQTIKHKTVDAQQRRRPFVFCFVRHPLQWYESWWRYMCGRAGFDWSRESDLHSWHPCLAIKTTGHHDINQFARNVLNQRPGFVTELYSMYTQPGIDYVGRQENLTEDLIQVLNQLQVSFDAEAIRAAAPVNVSLHSPATAIWDAATRTEIEKTEYAGMLRFGYAAANNACLAGDS